LCRPGYLHASPTPPEAASFNARWPYRLFRVDGTPAVDVASKTGFRQLTVVEERPVSECFGPNGVEVLRVIRRAEQLTKDEVGQLNAVRAAAPAAVWDAAGDAAQGAVWDAAGDAAWYAAGAAAWYAVWAAVWDAVWAAAGDAAGADAGAAARNAGRGVVARPLIGQHGFTQQHFDTLVGPWLKVVGPTWEADDDR